MVNTKTEILIWLAIVLGVNIGHDLMHGPQAAFCSELFGTRVRYSGASLGYQLASVFAGGFAPLVAAALAEGVGLAGRGPLHGGHRVDHGGRDPAHHRDLPERHRHRRRANRN